MRLFSAHLVLSLDSDDFNNFAYNRDFRGGRHRPLRCTNHGALRWYLGRGRECAQGAWSASEPGAHARISDDRGGGEVCRATRCFALPSCAEFAEWGLGVCGAALGVGASTPMSHLENSGNRAHFRVFIATTMVPTLNTRFRCTMGHLEHPITLC